MRLPLNLFGYHGADNRSAPLPSAAFAALPSPAQSTLSPTLLPNIPQAHVASETYSPTYPADQYATFSPGPFDTNLESLGLGWDGSLLNESTATTSYDDAHLPASGLPYSSPPTTYTSAHTTETEPTYYPPTQHATPTIDDVEFGFNTYLLESANPSFLSNRSAWFGPAPEELLQPEKPPELENVACPEDCFDITGLSVPLPEPLHDSQLQTVYNTTPSTASYNFSPSTASYDTSPSAASFEGSLFEQYLAPYSPAATSVDPCSPTWPSSAKPMLPPSQPVYNTSPSTVSYDTAPSTTAVGGNLFEQYLGPYSPGATFVDTHSAPSNAKPVLMPTGAALGPPAPYEITAASSLPVASSSKRRREDNVLEMPRTKKIKEAGEYQGLLLPLPVASSSKRRLEDDEESVDEPLMKKMRKMKNKKRPARSAETLARRVSTEALRPPQLGFAGPSHGDISTSEDRTKFSNRGVEGPEQTASGSSSQTTQVKNTTPAPRKRTRAAPAPRKRTRAVPASRKRTRVAPEPVHCLLDGCEDKAAFGRQTELDRHTLWVHIKPPLRCPCGCPGTLARPDSLSRHLVSEHGYESRAAGKKANSIAKQAIAEVGRWR